MTNFSQPWISRNLSKVCNLKDNVFVLNGKAEQDNDDYNDIVETVTVLRKII